MGRLGGSPTSIHRIRTPVSISISLNLCTILCNFWSCWNERFSLTKTNFAKQHDFLDLALYVEERNTLFWAPGLSLQYSQSVDAFNSALSDSILFLPPGPNFAYSCCIKSNPVQTFVPALITWPELLQASDKKRYMFANMGIKHVTIKFDPNTPLPPPKKNSNECWFF